MDNKSKKRYTKKFLLIFIVILIVLTLIPASPVVQADDDDHDYIDDDLEDYLIKLYAPTLYFKSGENFFPVDCTYHLNNSELWKWNGVKSLVNANPDLTTIAGYDEWHFLDNAIGDYADILNDYTINKVTLGYTIYGRVFNQTGSGGYVVQYWFFYAYNDHTFNQHEGDWELFEVILDSTPDPVAAACSQHHIGQTCAWSDVEKTNNTHPKVYVAKGSHANYFRYYQGKVGLENDEVGNDGFVLTYDDAISSLDKYSIVFLGENGSLNHPVPSQNWLDYEGRWGDWENIEDAFIGFAGPPGPAWGENAEKWVYPETWAYSSNLMVGSTWFIISWFMYYLVQIFLTIFAVMLVWKIYKGIKNRSSDEVPKLSVVLGGNAAFGVIIGVVAMMITVVVIFLPWYRVYIDFTGIVTAEGDIILIDGLHGVQANMLIGGSGMTPFFNVAIPFYIILGTGIILSILDIFGAKSAKKLGTKYIISGIIFIIIFIIMLVMMMMLGNLASMIEPMFGGSLPPEVYDIMNAIAAAPFGGTGTFVISGLGSVDVIWGFMIGGWLLMGSAITKIFAGIVMKTSSEKA